MKNDDCEKTKSNDNSQFRVVKNVVPKIIIEFAKLIWKNRGIGSMHTLKYNKIKE